MAITRIPYDQDVTYAVAGYKNDKVWVMFNDASNPSARPAGGMAKLEAARDTVKPLLEDELGADLQRIDDTSNVANSQGTLLTVYFRQGAFKDQVEAGDAVRKAMQAVMSRVQAAAAADPADGVDAPIILGPSGVIKLP